jgi:hypothetical protein
LLQGNSVVASETASRNHFEGLDQDKMISKLQELVKQFGGNSHVEENIFLASLPTVPFKSLKKN